MNILLDIILIGLLITGFVLGYRKGFVKTVWKIVALILTIVLVLLLKTPTINLLTNTRFAEGVSTKISDTVSLPQGGGVNIAENLNLPQLMQGEVNDQIVTMQGTIHDTVTQSLTGVFIKIIACIALFIIIRLSLALIFWVITLITELPIIRGVNKLVGGLLMLINVTFIILLLLAALSLYAPADSSLFESIANTKIVKYFYDYNILLQLFMKI